jgi:hypothetical protein
MQLVALVFIIPAASRWLFYLWNDDPRIHKYQISQSGSTERAMRSALFRYITQRMMGILTDVSG